MSFFSNDFLSCFEWKYCAVSQNIIFMSSIHLHFSNCKFIFTFCLINWFKFQKPLAFGPFRIPRYPDFLDKSLGWFLGFQSSHTQDSDHRNWSVDKILPELVHFQRMTSWLLRFAARQPHSLRRRNPVLMRVTIIHVGTGAKHTRREFKLYIWSLTYPPLFHDFMLV